MVPTLGCVQETTEKKTHIFILLLVVLNYFT